MKLLERIKAKARSAALSIDDALRRHLNGSLKIGDLTVYGANAMDFGITWWSPALGAYVCVKPPTIRRGGYFYVSRNATPWAAVIGCGSGLDRGNKRRIEVLLRAEACRFDPRDFPSDAARA